MANAMLEDDFKSSHPDLTVFDEEIPSNNEKMTTRKSVEFKIEPPPGKRSKPSVPWTAKQVVTAISTSITRTERLEAIQKAKDSFNHDLQNVHDDEMATGADAALAKHLTFLAFHAQQEKDQEALEQVLTEISLTCDALESLYRASSTAVEDSFERMGKELLQLLVGVTDNELLRRRRANEESQQGERGEVITNTAEGDLLLRKATKILGHFARVGSATKTIAHFPGLLGVLLNIVSLQPYSAVPWEARLSALWTVANLACNQENMQMMACTPGLLESLVEAASRPLHPGDSLEKTMEVLRSRAIASRAILNLSWYPENKVILAEHAPLLDLLTELTVHRNAPLNQSRTVRNILLTTRRHAVGALRNLAAAPRRIKIGLCEYKEGHVLDILTDAAINDPDTGVKDRAFAGIHNLAIHDTAEKIVNHPALVLALKNVLLAQEDATEHEEDSPKAHASATLLVLERSITPEMNSFENLRELLDAVNPSESDVEEDSLHSVHATAAV